MMRSRILLAAILLSGAAAMSGCASSERAQGWAPRYQPGDTAAEFTYVDAAGNQKALSSLFGDFTIIMFTRCDQDMHQPTARMLEEMVAENQTEPRVAVAGIDVHWSPHGCPEHAHCHVINDRTELASVCDGGGAIRALYGIHQSDGLFLVDARGRVLAAAPLNKAAAVRAELHERVRQLQHDRERRETFTQ